MSGRKKEGFVNEYKASGKIINYLLIIGILHQG